MFGFCKSPTGRQYLVIIAADLNMFALGVSLSWVSPMVLKLKEGDGTGLRPITDEEGSWIASIGLLVCLPLHFTMGPIMDKIGRKTCLAASSIPRIIGCLLLMFASEVWVVILARAVIDVVTLGVTLTVTATYTTEIASKEIRGALGTVSQVSSTTGMLVFFGLAPFLPYFYVNLLLTCIVIAISIPTWFLPESPYYLYSKGHKEECIKMLTYYRGSEALAYEEIKDYESSSNASLTKSSVVDFFKNPITVKTFIKAIFLGLFYDIAGYNAIMFYMMEILKSTKTTVSSNLASLANGCIQLIASFFTIMLTDRFGRKPILIGTMFGMAVGMLGLGTFFQLRLQGYEITGALNYLPLISMMLVMFSFSAGLGSLCWIYIAELFEGPARAMGLSLTVFIASFVIFFITKNFTALINAVGPAAVYWCLSFNCMITALYILFVLPEPKGKSFTEIQLDLGRTVENKNEI